MKHEIYFIVGEDIGRFKIGRTQCLSERLRTLRASAPCHLECVAYTTDAPELEPACHDAAEALGFERVYGEWFIGDMSAEIACQIVQRARVMLSKADDAQVAELHRRAFYAGGAEAQK